jgi:hypothetical protein
MHCYDVGWRIAGNDWQLWLSDRGKFAAIQCLVVICIDGELIASI